MSRAELVLQRFPPLTGVDAPGEEQGGHDGGRPGGGPGRLRGKAHLQLRLGRTPDLDFPFIFLEPTLFHLHGVFAGRDLVTTGCFARRNAVHQQPGAPALLAGHRDPSVRHLLHLDHVGGGGSGRHLDLLACGHVPVALEPDGVFARFHVAGVGRSAEGADVLAVEKDVGTGHIRRHLDPAEEMLFRQGDVDLVDLVGARADASFLGLPAARLDDQLHRLGRQRALPGRPGENPALLVVQVDQRARRLRVDDHQPLGVDARQPGLGGGRLCFGRAGRIRRRRRRRGSEQRLEAIDTFPHQAGVLGLGILLQILVEKLHGLLVFLGLLERDRRIEQERGEWLLVVGGQELRRRIVVSLADVQDLGLFEVGLGRHQRRVGWRFRAPGLGEGRARAEDCHHHTGQRHKRDHSADHCTSLRQPLESRKRVGLDRT